MHCMPLEFYSGLCTYVSMFWKFFHHNLPEVGIANFFLGPLIANPLIFF
jgi:hypothetical protein